MISRYFSLVKFSHTIFALPFALIGAVYGIQKLGYMPWGSFLIMLICMVTARNSAMAFNRYIDRKYDALNPRTASREIPSGVITPQNALVFIIINLAIFVGATAMLGRLALMLSPVAIIVICGYSLTKRFTSLCHIVLGLSLAIAPVGAYIAIMGEFSNFTSVLAFLVISWVSGFDIIYSLGDESFDRENSLHSIPERLGRKNALIVSALLHLVTIATVAYIGCVYLNNIIYFIGAAIYSLILIYMHIIVTPNDISKLNLAFATLNGVGSIVYASFVIVSMLFS
ncbi:MAG: UbiA-like polyprenyltransferase [Rikenellaceae bacterium]